MQHRVRIVAVTLLALASTRLTAQDEGITIRMAPMPSQTIHQRMTIATAMTVAPALASADSPSPPPELVDIATTMDLTSTVGPLDNRGEYDARVVIEHATMTATSHGQVAAPQVGGHGPTVLFRYDDHGRMTGATVESEGGYVDTAVTRAMTAMLATVAPITLSIGQTVTVPMETPVPLPGGSSLSTRGETRLTLTSVSFDGADRIAHLAVTTTTSEIPTISEGKMDVNIDRGIVVHNEEKTTLGGLSSASLRPAKPGDVIRTTVTVSMDLVR